MIESPFLQFLWMVQGHLSLVHDLKKQQKKKTHRGRRMKASSCFKTWKLVQEQNKCGSEIAETWKFMYCAPRANHGIYLTEKSVWRWRPYVNCIIANKLNLVKLPSASLWCVCLCLSLRLLQFERYLHPLMSQCANLKFKIRLEHHCYKSIFWL